MTENPILAVIRLTSMFLMFISITWHVAEKGLAHGQSEKNSDAAITGWLLFALYLILFFADLILKFGRDII